MFISDSCGSLLQGTSMTPSAVAGESGPGPWGERARFPLRAAWSRPGWELEILRLLQPQGKRVKRK